MRGSGSDIVIEAEEIAQMRERINRIIAHQTGQSIEKVRNDTERNFWLTAEEAMDYGLVGHIVKSTREVLRKAGGEAGQAA